MTTYKFWTKGERDGQRVGQAIAKLTGAQLKDCPEGKEYGKLEATSFDQDDALLEELRSRVSNGELSSFMLWAKP